jgi:exopolyphosphatase/guanosine-5'-triphosphate,3'-diphosphate pyrophosphatase
MKPLNEEDRLQVPRAVSLLRLARALNLGRSDAVRRVRVQLRDAEVRLSIIPKRGMGADLEMWAIEKERNYFRELFGRALSAAAE